MDNSFDENDSLDLAGVVAELRDSSDGSQNAVPKKNLSDVFDGCMAINGGMKVYLRVRPIKAKEESTVVVESDTSIVTNAPESSKRAQYTKTEARHYVSQKLVACRFCMGSNNLYSCLCRCFLASLVPTRCRTKCSSTPQLLYCAGS
jgi:hypothetical protein